MTDTRIKFGECDRGRRVDDRHHRQRGEIMREKLTFMSDGLKLSGVLHIPEQRPKDVRLPAFLVLHGFVGSKDESHAEIQATMLEEMGYAAFRFDMRCCGDSEGERKVRCFDQVADTKNALTFISARSEIDPKRIGVIGHSWRCRFGLYGRHRRSCGLRDFLMRVGTRRAQVSRPAPYAGSFGQIHRTLREGTSAEARNGQEHVDLTLRCGADPGSAT